MRTPQVEPDWEYGIWNGHNLMVKPVDKEINRPRMITSYEACNADALDDPKIRYDFKA